MSKEITTTTPSEQFREKAADLMKQAADMSLHELVDEFQSLSAFIADNSTPRSGYGYDVNDAGKVAVRERQVINAAARARFGISFDTYDRPDADRDDF